MDKAYISNAVLVSQANVVSALIGTDRPIRLPIDNRDWLSVMESLVFGCSLEVAYQRLVDARTVKAPSDVMTAISKLRQGNEPVALRLSHNKVSMSKPSGEFYDLTASSRQNPQVLSVCFSTDNFNENIKPIAGYVDFCVLAKRLQGLGLVTPMTGMLDWGDFKRLAPICPVFGSSRGTPIDRVYLNKFVEQISSRVAGRALEIGGVSDNKTHYGFNSCTEYHGLEMKVGPGVTYVGDAHNTGLIEPESFDSILLFNVLEHCHTPQTVIDNIHGWLKPGGSCFLMVPSAQRVHDYPADYWRPMPDGIKHLFRNYKETQLYVYGNPVTVIAAMMGVAAEELLANEVDPCNPEYPVATCAVATK
jgi:SAM-dependent methyltransferase